MSFRDEEQIQQHAVKNTTTVDGIVGLPNNAAALL